MSEQLGKAWRSFLALGAGNYAAMAISVVTSWLLARRLGTAEFGHLALLLMASQVMLLVAVNWSHAGFVRFGAVEYASTGAVAESLWVRIGLVWPVACLGVATMIVVRARLAAYLDIPVAGVALLVVHFVATCALSLVGAVFQARNQMARYGICLFLDKTAMLICVLALPIRWTETALPTLACYAASSLAVSLGGAAVAGARALRPVLPGRKAYREMAVFSAPLMLTSWAGLFGTSWFDLVILKQYVPLTGIGTYSLATQLAGVIQQITVIFSTLLLPHLSVMVSQGDEGRIKTLLERLLPYWLLATSVLFGTVILSAPFVVPIVFGRSYAGSVPVLAVLMVASCALALYNALTPLVGAYGSTWTLTGVAFASTASNVVLDFALIPRYGVVGSAMATVVAYALGAVLVLLFVHGRTKARVLRLGWFGAPAIAACACFLLLQSFWFYPATVAAAGLTVALLIAAFRLFRREDAGYLDALRLRWPLPGAGVWSERRL